jgi:hypothetical protein
MANSPGINQYLKPLSWDVNLSEEEMEELFSGKKKIIRGITSQNIYVKLLSSYNWYTLLKIAGKEKLREILTDDIIKKLKSKTLQQKYFYARSVLF